MRRLPNLCLAAVFLLSAFSARSQDAEKTAGKTNQQQASKNEPIGVARMAKDGTIILYLRSKTDDGAVVESRLVYRKGSKQYPEILKHLGGLRPGQTKAVPAWPDEQ